MKRPGSVENLLYEDAKNRESKMQERIQKAEAIESQEPQVVTLDKSERAYAKKLNREL